MFAPLIQLNGIVVEFAKRRVLSDIDLSIRPSEIISLIGPNGSGKSTLVKVVLGLIKPDHGFVTHPADLRVGYMPQHFQVERTIPLRVERLLSIAAPKSSKGERLTVLAQVDAEHLHLQRIQDLSGGELRRVLLARALLKNPQLMVMDEPVQGVDLGGQADLYNVFTQIRDALGCAILLVSHDLHFVMAKTDRVVCLDHHICCSGHPRDVSSDPAFHSLFGSRNAASVGLYTHQHDHGDNQIGNLIQKDSSNTGVDA